MRTYSTKLMQLLVLAFALYAILTQPVVAAHAIHAVAALVGQFAGSLGAFFDALLAGA